MSRNRRILAAVLVGVAALVYGLSPLDIIPELLTGPFGLVDDLGVLGGAAFAIVKLLTGGPKPGPTPPPTT